VNTISYLIARPFRLIFGAPRTNILATDAINRYKNETLRVYGVLEIQLSGIYTGGEPRDYLAGHGKGKYSVADIKAWSWVKGWERSGFTAEDVKPFPNLLKWIDRVAARPAVQRGIGETYAQ
jgi:glutathione S-transferase